MTTTSDRAKRLNEIREAEKQTSQQTSQRKLRPHEQPLTPERAAEFETLLEQRRAARQAKISQHTPGQHRGVWVEPLAQPKDA